MKSWLRGNVTGLFGVPSVFGRRIKGMIRLRPDQGWTCTVSPTCVPTLRVGLGAGNDLLQLSDVRDFEGTGTLGNGSPPFNRQFSRGFFRISVSTVKILYCAVYEQNKFELSVLHTSVTHIRLN
jgi:hypothetical protein